MIISLKESIHISMNKCVSILKNNLSNIRTNVITPLLLKNIYIDYFGTKTLLQQLSSIIVTENNVLKITLFDISIKKKVEQAIINSNLGLNPISTGSTIRIPVPKLTEERRKKFVKIIRQDSEYTKISIRNIRRDANEKLKTYLKDKKITKDLVQDTKKYIQETTNIFIKKIDNIIILKENELMVI